MVNVPDESTWYPGAEELDDKNIQIRIGKVAIEAEKRIQHLRRANQ